MSPAANTDGCEMLRRSAPTATNPASVQAIPDGAIQAGARLPVAAMTQSASRRVPSDRIRPSGPPEASARWSAIPRAASPVRTRRFTGSACPASRPSSPATSETRDLAERLPSATCAAKASSTPAAPPPTTATCRAAVSDGASTKRVHCCMNTSSGRTGISRCPRPASRDVSVSPPVASDSKSNASVSPLDSDSVRRVASSPTTSARTSFAPASSASGTRSISSSSAR